LNEPHTSSKSQVTGEALYTDDIPPTVGKNKHELKETNMNEKKQT